MEKFLKLIEEKLIPLTEKIGGQRHLQAVRDGVIHTLPLILIGSFFLLASYPPGAKLEKLVIPLRSLLLIPYRFTFGLIALYVCIAVAYSLARSYGMDGISTSLVSGVVFFMVAVPRTVVGYAGNFSILDIPKTNFGHDLPMQKITSWMEWFGQGTRPAPGYALPVTYLGKEGLFLGILMAIAIVEIIRFLKNRKLVFKMPDGVPEGVAKSFEAIIPAFSVILFFWLVRDILKIDLPRLVILMFKPLVAASDTLYAVIILNLIDSIVWFAGIHPVAIIGPFARPIWLQLFIANADAAAAGLPLPHIAVDQFYYWFVWVGGSGATLGLVLILLFVPRSKFLRQLGKICLIPGLFGINEPLLFGLPIVANPLMIIPFTLVPLVAGIISYFAFYLNIVHRPFVAAPWTLPPPLGAFVSTRDWKAIVLSLLVVLISAVIYYPFLKVYDRQMLERERLEKHGENS